MRPLSALERATFSAIFRENETRRDVLEQAAADLMVSSLLNTGGGFFTYFSTIDDTPILDFESPLGESVYLRIQGMQLGLEALLFVEDGRFSFLEAYTVSGEDTSALDFETVTFRLSSRPGPWEQD